MKLPVIDFSSFDLEKPESLANIDHALSTTGFMAVSNLDISATLLAEIFQHSKSFFSQSFEEKARSAYRSAAENFGYQGLGLR